MIVPVYEVYSLGGSNCVIFATPEEAESQQILSPSDNKVYPARVYMTQEELFELTINRYMWA